MAADPITPLVIAGLCAFVAGMLLNLRWMLAQVRRLWGPALPLAGAWLLMYVAKVSFIDWNSEARDGIGGVASMDGSAFHQVLCTGGAAGLIALLLVSLRGVGDGLRRLPVLLLLTYAAIGLISTSYSPAPALTAFKASLLVIDALMLAVAFTMLRGPQAAMMFLNICYFVAYLFAAGALIGALLAPEAAFLHQYGALAEKRLQGLLPAMHPNEIGALGAIAAIVGFVRTFASDHATRRTYWGAQMVVGLTVVFLAQARTSLGGLVLGAALSAVAIPRLRRYVGVAGAAAVLLALFSAVHGGSVEFHKGPLESVLTYFDRGEEISGVSDVGDFHGRLDDWKGGARMIAESPVIGHGYDAGVRELGASYNITAPHMHNAHLQVFVNTGVIGYVPWITLVLLTTGLTFSRLLRPAWKSSADNRQTAAEIAAVMVAVLITTMTFSELAAHTQTFMLMLGILVYHQVSGLDDPAFARRAMAPQRGFSDYATAGMTSRG